jgi:hypothetical protein
MRRFAAVLFCCFVFQGVFPTPAQAWWEFIEEWSAPGPFYGWTIDGRLVCFFSDVGPGADRKRGTPDDTGRVQFGGIVYSACPIQKDQKRRAWIDLGMGFLWADHNPKYADGQRISLTTLEPSFSWRVIENKDWDFFDYGVGAGIYWVSSVAFPAVRGTFLEPVRVDFHATTRMIGTDYKRWWLGIPVFRAGLLVFPAGHETTAFAARPDAAQRVSRDWVRTFGIFADLDPLINRIKR